MSKRFAIPIEKCISIKENVFNNNQYKTVSVNSKTFYTNSTDIVLERNDTIYNINEDQTSIDKIIDDYVPTLKEEVNGTTFTIYIKQIPNTNIYKVGTQNDFDYKQEYIEFSGETSYFGFDINSIGFGFKAYSNITIVEKPYTTIQSDIITVVEGIRFKKAIQTTNSLNDINYIITEYTLEQDLGRDNIDYFKEDNNEQGSYYFYQNINRDNVFKATTTNVILLDDTQHEMFIQYKVDALNNKVYYYVCMLLNETRKDTVRDETTQEIHSRSTTVYRTNLAETLSIYNVFEQGEDTTFKTGTGTIADYELSSNNLINNQTVIRYINPNTGYQQEKYAPEYVTQMTKNFYENGVPTVEITLPIMPLEDLDGNIVVLGTGANAQNIVVGDTFKITKHGTWDNLKMYQVTTVETCFNGAYRWVIKAKETYELVELKYFVPQLGFNNSYYIKNINDFNKIINNNVDGIRNLQVGIIVKRHKTRNRHYGRQTLYNGAIFTPSHAVSFYNMIIRSDEVLHAYQFVFESSNDGNYYVENLWDVLKDGYLKPTKYADLYGSSLSRGRKMYNLIGICIKNTNTGDISKKSKNFIPVNEDEVEWQPVEKKDNITW